MAKPALALLRRLSGHPCRESSKPLKSPTTSSRPIKTTNGTSHVQLTIPLRSKTIESATRTPMIKTVSAISSKYPYLRVAPRAEPPKRSSKISVKAAMTNKTEAKIAICVSGQAQRISAIITGVTMIRMNVSPSANAPPVSLALRSAFSLFMEVVIDCLRQLLADPLHSRQVRDGCPFDRFGRTKMR